MRYTQWNTPNWDNKTVQPILFVILLFLLFTVWVRSQYRDPDDSSKRAFRA